jgi:hypothetical protein
MRTHLSRRVALGALAVLTTLAVVAPAQARSPVLKIEPRRVVPYRVGGVFRPDTDVLSVSGYAAWMIDEALGSTTALPPLGAAFLRAEREQGINARYFVAHVMLESGWGGSDLARLKRNLFGFNACDRDPWGLATRFPSHAHGVAAVAAFLHGSYLTPGGRWWSRFATPRAINIHYASDPHWADKVANLANIIDGLVVTLRERWVRFLRPAFADAPVVGAPVVIEVPWRAKPGAQIPAALRFAVRWTPIAVVEAAAEIPAAAPGAPWRFALRTDGPDHVVRLELEAPALAGLWRLDVEARDSDGRPLPETDRPPIPSLEVRVMAVDEIAVGLSVGADGDLAATVTIAGPGPAPDDAGVVVTQRVGAGATVEVWTLPLDPAQGPYRQATVPLSDTLGPGAPWTVSVGAPAVPAVVVARITGGLDAPARAVPTAALASRDADGRLTLTPLTVASPRDDLLLGRQAAPAPITLRALDEPGALEAEIAALDAPDAPDASPAPAPAAGAPGRPALLVRSLAVEGAGEATPLSSLLPFPEAWPGAARISLSGLPAGVRLVVAGIVPPDGGPVDPATLALAWIAVAGAQATGVAPD